MMIGELSLELNLCCRCLKSQPAEGVAIDGLPACKNCKRIALLRAHKGVPGIYASGRVNFPVLKTMSSLPGQLDLFAEGE